MDFAINKATGEMISAFEVYNNGSYQNLTKGEWIAPEQEIFNWEELGDKNIPIHYVQEKKYKNYNGTAVVTKPHFALYPNSPANACEESPQHKMLKNWLFNRMYNDDLEIRYSKGTKPHKYDNKIKLSKLNINWNDYSMEVTTKSSKYLRADILIPFKEKDNFLGTGIIFEIQLSKQTDSITYNRTIERALHGYSVAWLFEKDFDIIDGEIFLKENIIKVNSFSEQIHFARKKFVGKLKIAVENQCRYLDEKIKEVNISIELATKDSLSKLKTREATLFNKIENIENNPFKELIENYKEQIINSGKTILNEINLNNHLDSLGLCPNCKQGFMMRKKGKFGFFYGCSNYPNCRNIVGVKDD